MGSTTAADRMFGFLDRVEKADNCAAVGNCLQESIAGFGLETYGVSFLPSLGEDMRPLVTLCSWPTQWAERYLARRYVFADPIIHRVRVSEDPFLWSDVCSARPLRERSKLIMDEATEFGLRAGFTVPIHTLQGMQAVVTFGSRAIDLSMEDRGALNMIALYVHRRLRSLTGTPSEPKEALSSRERECVQWCAEGKSSWAISCILGIAENTVNHHIAHATRKLDVASRSHLVAEALRWGFIS